MTTLRTNTELDADILSVVCMLDGPIRMEDVVPHMMSRNDWFAAKSHALDKGWIVKDSGGPRTEEPAMFPMSLRLSIATRRPQLRS